MDTSERGLEDIIVAHLRDVNGYNQGTSGDYDKTFAMLPANVEAFLRKTQPEKVDELRIFSNNIERNKFFTRLRDEITKRGITDVLRKGFQIHNSAFRPLLSNAKRTESNGKTALRG